MIQLLQRLSQEVAKLEQSGKQFIIPQRASPEHLGIVKYNGWEGIRQVYLEVLSEAIKTGEPILAFENIPDKKHSPIGKGFLENYLKNRFENKVLAKVIAPSTSASREYQKCAHPFTETRIMNNLSLKGTITIVGSLVMSYSIHPVQGTLRRDSIEAHNLKQIFQYLWDANLDWESKASISSSGGRSRQKMGVQ